MGTPPSPIPPSLPAGYDPSTGVMPPSDMVKVGNIDVNHRPVIWNDDGSPSTIYSAPVPTGDGNWALIPTIADGKFLTPNGKIPDEKDADANEKLEAAATEHFKKTGEHLGIFRSQKAADDYANATHAFMPNGAPEKVYVSHYEGDSNMPLTRKEYEAELAKRKQAYHVDFSDLGGKLTRSAHPLLQKYVDAVTVKNPEYEEAELHRIATMPEKDFVKWYASESDPVLRSIGNIANAIARIIPGETEASEAQTAAQKTPAGKQVGDFVRGQLEHPEQVAMASADAGLPSDFITSIGGRTLSHAPTPEKVSEFKNWFGNSKILPGAKPAVAYHGTTSPVDFEEFSTEGPPTDEEGNEVVSSSGDPNTYMGAHFAVGKNAPSVASKFAENKEGWMQSRFEGENPKPRVIPAHLKIENPRVFKSETEMSNFINEGHIHDEELLNEAARADGVDPDDDEAIEQWQHKYDNDASFRSEQNSWIMRQSPSQLGYEDHNPLSDAARELGEDAKSRLIKDGHDGVLYKNDVEGGHAAIAFHSDQIRHALPHARIVSEAYGSTAKATPQATVAAGGSGALSSEELARPETFVKYSKSGTPTHLGKQPDATLKPGEAILAINNRTGQVRVQNTEGITDSEALRRFRPHIQENFGPK